MISNPILLTTAVLVCLGFVADAQADSHLTETTKADSATFAVGIKRGDGMANNPGIDAAWKLNRHVILGVAGYYLHQEHGRGVALAPSMFIRLFNTRGRLIPFAHLGVKHLRRHYGDRWGNGSGGFGAVGLSWMFAGGINIRLGTGFHGMAAVEARSEKVSVQQPSHAGFFFETGMRYWF